MEREHKVKRTNVIRTEKEGRKKIDEKETLLLASHENRINHLPGWSLLGPEDGGNKTSP